MREELWRVHLPRRAAHRRRRSSSPGWRAATSSPAATSATSALRAAFLAAQEDRPLSQEHLERAVGLEYREIGKLVSSGTLE